MLNLCVYLGEIGTEDSCNEQLYTTYEDDNADKRRPPCNGVSLDELAHDNEQQCNKRTTATYHPNDRCHQQRNGREGQQTINGIS